jgi:hypothetical protein
MKSKAEKRQYPRQAWVLLPSFKPKEITVEKQYKSWSGAADGDLSSTGKWYAVEGLYPTKAAAIAAGRQEINAQQTDLDKRHERIQKRIAALDKAEAE